eukprot:11820966-Ditylum_brightwellii.AAC.1
MLDTWKEGVASSFLVGKLHNSPTQKMADLVVGCWIGWKLEVEVEDIWQRGRSMDMDVVPWEDGRQWDIL